MPYPTKEAIMKLPRPTFKRGTITAVRMFKKTRHGLKADNTCDLQDELQLLGILLYGLSGIYEKPFKEIRFGDRYCYQPKTKIITFDRKEASIISALHEFAHHLYGRSELTACRWSVWLFKETFPKAFQTLHWKGHLLVKAAKTT